jgi:hypothetical protein
MTSLSGLESLVANAMNAVFSLFREKMLVTRNINNPCFSDEYDHCKRILMSLIS